MDSRPKSDEELASKKVAEEFTLGYRPELDGFRGIAILLVFVHHIYPAALPGGFIGVDVFFVLSGFLITTILLKEWNQRNSIDLKGFYLRRLFRLMPAVVFLVLVLFGYSLVFANPVQKAQIFDGIWLTLSYVSNWLYAFDYASADNALGVTWSLAIEEQFYLIFPIILFISLKLGIRQRSVSWILAFLVFAAFFHRFMMAINATPIIRMYYGSDTRADALLIGCLGAFLITLHYGSLKQFAGYLGLGSALSILTLGAFSSILHWKDMLLYKGGYTLIAILVVTVLLYLVVAKPKWLTRPLTLPPLVWVGKISYGLYLWHWTVRFLMYEGEASPQSVANLLLTIILSLVFTIISYYLVEKPFLKLKDKFRNQASSV